ncbi:SurA N-terminal domain-containing protein [Anaerococcus sp. AGMB00486]|uniref:peptidylprolyl isomerase n=2 Tax=Anaerococcus TaxID=165779 RepID=A0ABX2N7B4_9FIRM|nr:MULTISPECIES: SurA N-terminal domain-containing protein [Anaerococcus]MSS76938.1 hypothetical protein [Anaerococcus porci]NVF10577.1 SurA N-terminal domain-containing protein [Anaerococcus faecalis]
MIVQTKKTKKILIVIISLISFLITSCSTNNIDKNNCVAIVDNKPIFKEKFEKELSFYQKFYIKKYGESYLDDKNKNGDSNFKKLESELLDSLIKDQIFLNDLDRNNIKVSKNDSQNLLKELSDKIGDEASLLANVEAFGSDQSEINEILFNDSIRKKHWEFFVNNNKIKDKDVREFYKNNKKLQKMYKYDVLIFDDKLEAQKVKEQINNSNDFRKFLESDIRNYEIFRSDFVYNDDKLLSLANIYEKDKVSKIFENEDSYFILMVNSLNTKENDLLVRAKEIYLKNEYDKYIKNLIKNSNINLFIR